MTPKQLAFDLGHRPAHGAEDFLVAPCNEAAVGWIDRFPDWPAPAVVLSGPPGSGKTHLARVFIAKTGATEIDLDALDKAAALEDGGRAVIEGADRIAGDTAREEELFHLYNRMALTGGGLLLTAIQPASRWELGLKDLESRLRAAPNPEIGPPDDATLSAVLVKLFADRQLQIDQDVIRYIVPRIERTFAAVRTFVAQADQTALENKRRVTVPLARSVLSP